MHILCTNGTPIVDTLDHLPPLPLFVDYRYTNVNIRGEDELGIYHALRLRDRVRRIDLHLPPSILSKSLMLMDEPFPILEHLSLSLTVNKITILTLPKTFLAPNLRHLALLGICLPKRLRLLLSTVSLVTLALTNLRASGCFLPRLLVARLRSLPQLEGLSIGFSIPIPRPSAERELLGNQGTPVTLLNLKHLRFQGIGAYLECLVAQIRTPLLERLDITLFNQIAFALPHLSHFTNRTEGLKLPTAEAFFGRDEVSITLGHHGTLWDDGRFVLRVMCKPLDWQIDCAAQICIALMPALSGVEKLTLDFYELMMPSEWQNGEIDGTTWHELLRPFIGVKDLRICSSLSEELSRALQVDGVGSDPGLLPGLQELARGSIGMFDPFLHARRVAGRPVLDTNPNRITSPYGQLPPGFVPHVPVPDASSSSDRLSWYHPVRTPLTSTTADSPVIVPPPSIFSRSPESSSSEEEDDEVASSIASSDDSLTTPPPPRRRPRPRPNTYDAAPIPPGLEYPAAPLMRGDA